MLAEDQPGYLILNGIERVLQQREIWEPFTPCMSVEICLHNTLRTTLKTVTFSSVMNFAMVRIKHEGCLEFISVFFF